MLCAGLDYLAMALAPSLAWLFVGRALAGVAGAIFGPANAFLADVTPPAKRAQAFGMMGAAFGFGFIIGPALGGLLGQWGTRAPFYAAASPWPCSTWSMVSSCCRSRCPRSAAGLLDLKRANPLGTLLTLRKYPGVLGVAASLLIWQIAYQVYPSTWAFFTIAKFDLVPAARRRLAGLHRGLHGSLTQALLVGKLVARFGERKVRLPRHRQRGAHLHCLRLRPGNLAGLRAAGLLRAPRPHLSVDQRHPLAAGRQGGAGRAAGRGWPAFTACRPSPARS